MNFAKSGILLCLFFVACGGGAENSGSTVCVDLNCTGTIVAVAGTGRSATDSPDANADGNIDVAIPATTANLDLPIDTRVGPDGLLYIIDWNGHKVRVLNADGSLAFLAGTGFEGDACEAPNGDGTCPALYAELNHMTDVAFDPDGNMVIAAWHNAKIKRVNFTTGLMEEMCGTGNRKYEGDAGPCESAGVDVVSFDLPSSVAYDAAGNLFISDQANQIIRRLATSGTMTTVVGNCPGENGAFGCTEAQGYAGDGGPATSAKLNNELGQGTDPQGKIAFGPDGSLYIADSANNVIRKVAPGSDGILGDGDASEEIITTVAGSSEAGYSGDGGAAVSAMLNRPRDVFVISDGTLFIADTGNNCIRKVDTAGLISTVAGACGTVGDDAGDGSLATDAKLNSPYGIEIDDDGNLYIADTLNNRIRVVYGVGN